MSRAAFARSRWPTAHPCSGSAHRTPNVRRPLVRESHGQRWRDNSSRESTTRSPRAAAAGSGARAHPSRDALTRSPFDAENGQTCQRCPVTDAALNVFFVLPQFQSTLSVERTMDQDVAPPTHGLVLNWAARYDLFAWLLTHGRERALREAIIRLAELQTGNDVLD